jgi:hypothetical protein
MRAYQNLKEMSLVLPLPHGEKLFVAKYTTKQLLSFLSLLMGVKLCLSLMEEKSLKVFQTGC